MSDQNIDMIMMKFEKPPNLPQSSSLPIIVENYSNINGLIEKMHNNILLVFKKREDELLSNYKKEMVKAQLALKELSESTSENELRRRMIQKKEELERERQLYIQQSIEFCNRCKGLKLTLSEVIANTKDLESEIKFLDEQLVYAEKHNQTLQEELSHLNDDKNDTLNQLRFKGNNLRKIKIESLIPLITSKANLSKSNNKITSFSQMKVLKDYSMTKLVQKPQSRKLVNRDQLRIELLKQQEINLKLIKMLENTCFQETVFERNFSQAVQTVQQKKEKQDEKQNDLQRIRPKILPSIIPDDKQDISNSTNATIIDFTILSQDSLNDYYKRKVFEEFLEKDDIKKIIYELLFFKGIKV